MYVFVFCFFMYDNFNHAYLYISANVLCVYPSTGVIRRPVLPKRIQPILVEMADYCILILIRQYCYK